MQEEFERKLDLKLLVYIVATGLMSFTGIVIETAMNVTFPTLVNEFNISIFSPLIPYSRIKIIQTSVFINNGKIVNLFFNFGTIPKILTSVKLTRKRVIKIKNFDI